MPIGKQVFVRCKSIKCRHRFMILIGDIRPYQITCPKCGKVWFYK